MSEEIRHAERGLRFFYRDVPDPPREFPRA